MKTKKLYIAILAATLTLLCSSCGDGWIDNVGPTDKGETEKSLKTVEDAKFMLNGVYDIVRHYEYYGAGYMYYGDVKGDDMQANGATMRTAKYYFFDHNTQDSPSTLWNKPYSVIRNMNNVIRFANTFEGTESEMTELASIKAEAMVIRALAHFDLVKIYGAPYLKDKAALGVPIVKEPVKYDYKPKRNSVEEVYNFVVEELVEARKVMSPKIVKGKMNKIGAGLLLSRVYLFMGKNKEAFEVATETITEAEANKYSLWTNAEYATVWADEFTSESILELSISADEGGGNDYLGYLMYNKGYDDMVTTQSFADFLKTDSKDVRNKLISVIKNKNYCMKFPGNNGENPKYANILVMRLSELYLIAAEAAVKTNNNAGAIKYLKPIVSRANPEKTVEGAVTLDQVLDERRKELFGEGHRFFDAIRNNKRIERVGDSHLDRLSAEARSFDWNFKKTIMPIPKSEMDVNGNMVQNPQ